MDRSILAVLVLVLLSIVGVLGDYFLKLASNQERLIWNGWFPLGLVVYSLTAFGWVYAMRSMKLATIGVVYSLCVVLFLAVMGIVLFKERLTYSEAAGIVMAIGSLMLLTRFAH